MEISVRDIIDKMIRFHFVLWEYYQYHSRKVNDTRMKMLLDFLVRSEQSLENFIEKYRNNSGISTLNRKVILSEETCSFPEVVYFMNDRNRSFRSYSDIMMIALQNDSSIARYCRSLTADNSDPNLKSVFSNICRMSRREKRNLISYNYMFSS